MSISKSKSPTASPRAVLPLIVPSGTIRPHPACLGVRRASWARALAAFCLAVTLCSQAADQFVQVANPGWTNSNQLSATGAWGDYDGDGRIDLFVANTENNNWGVWTNFLYHNNGGGTFIQQLADRVGAIASDRKTSWGGYWGDVNNDGLLDLLVVGVGIRLYLNQGTGVFQSVATKGMGSSSADGGWAPWADYDNDGNLDVFVCMTGHNQLWRGRGDGTFASVTKSALVTDSTPYSNDATWGDFDNDGRLDLIVANGPNVRDFFYHNDGNGKFTRLTNSIVEEYGSWHAAWGDYDNDGFLDLAACDAEGTRLFRNNGIGDLVLDISWTAAGSSVPVWADYDNDGYLDLLVPEWPSSPGQLHLFHNEADGAFTEVEDVLTRPSAAWYGGGWGDYDNDGFMDLFVTTDNGSNLLYHNLGNTNGWLKFQLQGTAANRTAIGAKVRVKATIGGKTFWQMREVSGGNYCQNDLRPNFGLGDATNVELVRIEWPSGIIQDLHNVASKQLLKVTEPVQLAVEGAGTFRIQSWQGQIFGVQTSNDLLQWSSLATVTNLTGTLRFTAAATTTAKQVFYRVLSK